MIEPETAGGGVVFDMDLTKLSVWFIDWSPALLCSDSDYCGRWRRRYELQPTLCDRSCKRFPCPWFTAERSSPLLFLQLPRITHSGTLGVDMPVIDLYFCICICAISLLRREHVNDWFPNRIQNLPITHSPGPTWKFIFMWLQIEKELETICP